jgi:glycosyltransferase involved in cell wall biosynthesis
VEHAVSDSRLLVIRHAVNKGVGGAVISGYRAALKAGADIVVKLDGDGQMDPRFILNLVTPIMRGEADYAKGNRFCSFFAVRRMPWSRLAGNAVLSFMTKLSSGYWSLFDPTNGYTAINACALTKLDLKNISERYFFETDMLVHLSNVRAVVADVPMEASYGDEVSNLKIRRIVGEFLIKHFRALIRRIVYQYFMRDFSLASLNLLFGLAMLVAGAAFGAAEWWISIDHGVPATAGTVVIAALPILLGFQLLQTFLGYDINNEPRIPLQKLSNPLRSSFPTAS